MTIPPELVERFKKKRRVHDAFVALIDAVSDIRPLISDEELEGFQHTIRTLRRLDQDIMSCSEFMSLSLIEDEK